jgi:hypothetical protein
MPTLEATANSREAATSRPLVPQVGPDRKSCWIVFAVLFVVAFAFTLHTRHVWEDFYITYRASKNLATGNGLTFTPGERVHSFTSPLGTLLPAVASLMTFNQSDTGALWIFRLMSIAAYAAAGVVLWQLARRLFRHAFVGVFIVALMATDAKIIDYTINGMETPYLLLFLAWTMYALFLTPPRLALHLGLSWAGLMWSRPDSCVYIAAIAIGTLLFKRQDDFWRGRWELLKTFVIAGCITTAVYGPWIVWAWWYYGSPVPHTVIAKGMLMPKATPEAVMGWIVDFPKRIFTTGASLGTIFMPPYALHTGWPGWAIAISRYLATAAILVWMLPFVRREARIASFTFLCGNFYLNYFSNYYAPWYVPTLTVLAFITLAGLLDSIAGWFRREPRDAVGLPMHWSFKAVAMLVPLGALALLVCTAHQMRHSQSIVENGNRRAIGEWLKANANSPRDTAFFECLGYLGFFSGLKIYDWPGLGSPEVVEARRDSTTLGDYTQYFPELITELHPDWLVLRASEVFQVKELMPDLLTKYYRLAKTFDVRDQVKAVRFLPGRGYLEFDAYFEVYRRNWDPKSEPGPENRPPDKMVPITVGRFVVNQTWAGPAFHSLGHISAHAPSLLASNIPAETKSISGAFGFFPGAYENAPQSTPGAIFSVRLVTKSGERIPLFSKTLTPTEETSHRGDQTFSFELPNDPSHYNLVEFVIDTIPGKNNAFGWTYWRMLKFEL